MVSRAIIFCLAVLLVGCTEGDRAANTGKETALDRVRRTGVLRCGYAEWPKYVDRDPATGKLSGIFPDLMEHLAKSTGIQVEWAESIGFAELAEALELNRFDAVCSGIWTTGARAAALSFSRPIAFSPIYMWSRKREDRIKSLKDADNKAIRVATLDGEYSQYARRQLLPNSLDFSLPKSSTSGEIFLALATNKADLTFSDVTAAKRFSLASPDSIQRVESIGVVSASGMTIAIRKGEWGLKDFLDTTLDELLWDGTVRQILAQYEEHEGEFLQVDVPWSKEAK